MNLGSLEFRPEDFTPPYPFLVSVEMSKEEAMAHIANHFLRERLAKAPEVWREFDRWTMLPPDHPNFKTTPLIEQHRAHLVCIEEIK